MRKSKKVSKKIPKRNTKKLKKLIEKRKEQSRLQKKYDELMHKFLTIEKKLQPRRYNYRLFSCDGEKYIRFHPNAVYPLTLIENFVKVWKKQKVPEKSTVVGLTLIIEGLKGIKKSRLKGTVTRTKIKGEGKRKVKNANKLRKRKK